MAADLSEVEVVPPNLDQADGFERHDVEYVNDCSFLLDIKIIIMTIKKVLVREGIGQGEQHPGSLHEIRKYALLKDEVEK